MGISVSNGTNTDTIVSMGTNTDIIVSNGTNTDIIVSMRHHREHRHEHRHQREHRHHSDHRSATTHRCMTMVPRRFCCTASSCRFALVSPMCDCSDHEGTRWNVGQIQPGHDGEGEIDEMDGEGESACV
jgi:hypothetical protein